MKQPNRDVTVDLGEIEVKSDGDRDTVYLKYNKLRVFSVTCSKGKASRLRVNPRFYEYPQPKWNEVINLYLTWKREHIPDLELPKFRPGTTRSGRAHPWKRFIKSQIEEKQQQQRREP